MKRGADMINENRTEGISQSNEDEGRQLRKEIEKDRQTDLSLNSIWKRSGWIMQLVEQQK